jgi:hypothetical protein
MNRSKALAGAAAAALLALSPLAAHAGVTLSNPHDGGTVGPFGNVGIVDDTGEVFTAPVSGVLDSFSFTVEGEIDQIKVGIAEWNGPATFAGGFGVSAIDYESGVLNNVTGDVTFNPDVAVTAGLQYLFFITTDGLTNPPDSANGVDTSQTPTPGIDYFVYTQGPVDSPSWIYIDPNQYTVDLAITAHFSTPNPCNVDHPLACIDSRPGVPEPSAWALMILGFGGAGAVLRRRRGLALAIG